MHTDLPSPPAPNSEACTADAAVVNIAVFADPSGQAAGTLTVHDMQDRTLACTEFSSNVVIPVSPAVTHFRLRLELPDGALFPGSLSTGNFLSAAVFDYEDGQYVALSPLTTLVDAYMQAHPGVAQPLALVKVLTCLGLPDTVQINGFMFDTAHELFDSRHFYAAVDAAGGMAALADLVIAKIDNGVGHSFGQPAPLLEKTAAQGTSMVDDLTSSLTSWAGGKVKGWLLEATGVNSLLKELGLFDDDKATKQLAAITEAINALAKQVKELPDAVAYNNRLVELEALRAAMEEWNTFLITNTESTPAEPEALEQWSSKVLSSTILTNLHDVEVGSGDKAKGLIGLLAKELPQYYDGRPETPYTKLFFNQFNAHRQVQELALNYKIEATHARTAPNLAAAELMIDTHHIHIKQQRQAYPGALNAMHGVLDRSTGLIWARQMIVIDGYTNIAGILRNSAYRLPTIAELQSLIPTAQARAALSIDASKYPPEIMYLFGFEPERYPDGNYKHFADMGEKGSRHPPGYIFSSECGADNLYGVARVINLYDGKIKTVDYNVPGGMDRTSRTHVPLLLVRKDPGPNPIYVYLSHYDPETRTAQMEAILNFGDGRHLDATKEVIWKITGSSPETAHISNGPTDSGKIQFRTAEKPAEAWTVTGELNYWGSDLPNQFHKFQETVKVLETGERVYPRTAAIVLAPAHKKTNRYPFSYDLKVYRTENTGRVVASNDYNALQWSCSDPSVAITKSGRVTVAQAPAKKKEIQIKVRVGQVEGVAYLILAP